MESLKISLSVFYLDICVFSSKKISSDIFPFIRKLGKSCLQIIKKSWRYFQKIDRNSWIFYKKTTLLTTNDPSFLIKKKTSNNLLSAFNNLLEIVGTMNQVKEFPTKGDLYQLILKSIEEKENSVNAIQLLNCLNLHYEDNKKELLEKFFKGREKAKNPSINLRIVQSCFPEFSFAILTEYIKELLII